MKLATIIIITSLLGTTVVCMRAMASAIVELELEIKGIVLHISESMRSIFRL